ncbi:hypothetical protein ES703_80570 [subsurface metagenome]
MGAIPGKEIRNLIKERERGNNMYYVNYLGSLRGRVVSHKYDYVN